MAKNEVCDTLRLALSAGEIMLQHGAETHRVEDTMRRLLVNCGYETAESFVTTTGIFINANDTERGTVTMLKRVRVRENNFDKIARVNDLSRSFAEGKITVEDALAKLDDISASVVLSPFVGILASSAACFSFCFIFGGTVADCFNAFLTGLIIYILVTPLRRARVTGVIVNALGGAAISLSALTFMNLGLGDNIDKVIIGSLMPLLPGVAMSNAIRDVLGGDYLSGTARLADVLLVAIALAAGVGVILRFWFFRFGGVML
jgi:uncharacterized membrane protein YjjP (DUF1212 family)